MRIETLCSASQFLLLMQLNFPAISKAVLRPYWAYMVVSSSYWSFEGIDGVSEGEGERGWKADSHRLAVT